MQATAAGSGSEANGLGALAFGAFATARGSYSVALGYQSFAPTDNATAIGYLTRAQAENATAIGASANASFAGSTAVGQGATTTAANQVMLGGTGSSVRIGDIAASTAAQVGPVDAVTVDASGTLGRQAVAAASAVDSIRLSMNHIAAVTDAQFSALSGRVGALENGLAQVNFRLEDMDRGLSGGIAAASALGSAIAMPDKSLVIAGNVANYNGEQGYALNLTGRVSDRFAVGAGIAGNTGNGEVVTQAGFALGF
ncbi:hypothetical protein [Qipengyuania sp. SM2507]